MSDSFAPAKRIRPIIRVFISSTFSDLKAERDALQKWVYPKLETECLKKGFQFQAIDLRWGVPTEAGLDHRTMKICFEELRRAQKISPEPNFLILLGNRYGWRPLPEGITEEEYDALQKNASGEAERKVLKEWYRKDENSVPPVHVLRPRSESPDGQDYIWQKDGNGDFIRNSNGGLKSTDAWINVQDVLWKIINRAFPPEGLRSRFKTPLATSQSSIVRFQASATEQEIWAGALSTPNAQQHVTAFFRDVTNRDDFTPSEVRDFFDLTDSGEYDQHAATAQKELKDAIEDELGKCAIVNLRHHLLKQENGKVVVNASEDDLQRFCKQVKRRLKKVIKRQIKEYWQPRSSDKAGASTSDQRTARELEIERDEHIRFGNERGAKETFVGRDDQLQRILAYVRNDSRSPMVVHGDSGCGKTALLARAFKDISSDKKAIIRFIGVTPRSSDIGPLLSSLCQELRQRNPRADALPRELEELREEFSQHLQAATREEPLILFLDALDQLADADNGRLLNWLPPGSLPDHVKLVVSCLSNLADENPAAQPYTELKRREIPAENFKGLDELSVAEARFLLFDRLLPDARRQVSVDQRAQIEQRLTAPVCRHPIFLKLLFEEAQLWHSYDPVPVLGENVPALLGQLFDRLSQPTNHGPLLVNRVLGYLSASRHGLAESEILEILFADPEYRAVLNEATEQTRHELPSNAKRIPIALWSRLRFDLAPYLTERAAPGANVLTFYHRQVAEAATRCFLTDAVKAQTNYMLARYFRGLSMQSVRMLAETTYHLHEAGMEDEAKLLRQNPLYIGRRILKTGVIGLVGDFVAGGQYLSSNGLVAAINTEKRARTDKTLEEKLDSRRLKNSPKRYPASAKPAQETTQASIQVDRKEEQGKSHHRNINVDRKLELLTVDLRGNVALASLCVDQVVTQDAIEQFEAELMWLAERYDRIAISFASVLHVSAGIWGAIIKTQRNLSQRQGQLVVCDLKGTALATASMMRMNLIVPIFDSLNKAAAYFDPAK